MTTPASTDAAVGHRGLHASAVTSGPEARVVLRPIATPVPLGFLGLVVATSVLACFNLGWVPTGEQHQVAIVLISFGFPLQALATIFCLLGRDAPAAAGIGVQAGSWLAIGLLTLTGAPGSRSQTLGVLLFAAAGALLPSALTSAMGKVVPALVMGATALRFVLTGVYEKFGGTGWEHAAGWEGIALATIALYAALAIDLEAAARRTLLPVGRRGRGRRALEPGIAEDVDALGKEPGVRQQL